MQSLTKNRIVYMLLNSCERKWLLGHCTYTHPAITLPACDCGTCHCLLLPSFPQGFIFWQGSSYRCNVLRGRCGYWRGALQCKRHFTREHSSQTRRRRSNSEAYSYSQWCWDWRGEILWCHCQMSKLFLSSEGNKSSPLKREFIQLVKLQSKLYFFF